MHLHRFYLDKQKADMNGFQVCRRLHHQTWTMYKTCRCGVRKIAYVDARLVLFASNS